MRVLIDSSVWIDWFNAQFTDQTALLATLLHEEDVVICGPVLAEVLRGTREDAEYQRIQNRVQALEYLPMSARTFQHSADIYRRLRRRGMTLRNVADTFIAAVALEHQVPLLQNDSDFARIAREFPLHLL